MYHMNYGQYCKPTRVKQGDDYNQYIVTASRTVIVAQIDTWSLWVLSGLCN